MPRSSSKPTAATRPVASSEPVDAASPPDLIPTDEDLSGVGYEAAKDELTRIVATLESGQVGIEQAMDLWRRADSLAKHCRAWLEQAQASLDEAVTPPR